MFTPDGDEPRRVLGDRSCGGFLESRRFAPGLLPMIVVAMFEPASYDVEMILVANRWELAESSLNIECGTICIYWTYVRDRWIHSDRCTYHGRGIATRQDTFYRSFLL